MASHGHSWLTRESPSLPAPSQCRQMIHGRQSRSVYHIFYNQCRSCWWPGDGRNISDQGIDLVLPEHSGQTWRVRQNGRHFPDDIFKCFFLNENVLISIKISLNFIAKVPIHNIPALVQIMAWRRPGDKPLSEAMMIVLLTHICATQSEWVNSTVTFVNKYAKGHPFTNMV